MFVYNTISRDRRVLKEAESLVRAGWHVTVIGISLPRDAQPLHEVTEAGVVLRRVPMSLRVPEWRRKSALKGARNRFTKARRAMMRRAAAALRRRRDRARRVLRRPVAWSRRHGGRLRRRDRVRRFANWLSRRPWRRSTPQRRSPRPARRTSTFRRIAATMRSGVANAVAMAWVAVYAGVDRVAGGELDWWLNARSRWAEFARRAAAIAPSAAVYHGHDLSGIGAALAAQARHRNGALIYDAHELYVESGTLARRSRTLKYLLKRIERTAYQRADAVVTVNGSIARELQARYGRREISIVYNCATPLEAAPDDRIRDALGLPGHCRIALYQGALTEVRGLREVAAAVRTPGLEAAHLVFMGFGPMQHELEAAARAHPRIHVLPPVPPSQLDGWVASADACVMTNLPAGLNEWMSTPNKLFESIAAGVPVITSDFPERRAIVLDSELGPLGAVCDPTDPESIAEAMRRVLLSDAVDMAAMRQRCLNAARSDWNWAAQERRLLAEYDAATRAPHAPTGEMIRTRAA